MIARLYQAYFYFFAKLKAEQQKEVKDFLNEEEYEVFAAMGDYDQYHSYRLWNFVKKEEWQQKELYEKLALLHDCGKGNKGFLARCKTVIWDRQRKEDCHSKQGYLRLKEINLPLAKLCLAHHLPTQDKEMQKFQTLDDK